MTAPSAREPGAFVVRRSDRAELKAAVNLVAIVGGALVAILVAIAVLIALRGGSAGAFAERFWKSQVGPLTLAAVLALCAYFAWANAKHERSQETDADGISLQIDEAGLYLGGTQPKATAWPDIREVSRVNLPARTAEGNERWIPHLVVITADPGKLPPKAEDWGAIRRWPSSTESYTRRISYQDIVHAVERFSPTTPVTDRGNYKAKAEESPKPEKKPEDSEN
ncbi:hypothetical protein [Kribbella deserti]|uniref:DUF3239 domain-containing protein n=1 Tax=Kribbella deserti TaxID=1926257 RepID=A0ABV6QDD6_9ACTN